MSSDRIHLRVAEAREHSERALCGIGYDAEEARTAVNPRERAFQFEINAYGSLIEFDL